MRLVASGTGDARCGQPHRSVFRRIVQHTADDRRDVARSFEQHAGVVSGYEARGLRFLRHRRRGRVGDDRQPARQRLERGQAAEFRHHHVSRVHQLLHGGCVADDFCRERRAAGDGADPLAQFVVATGQKDRLRVFDLLSALDHLFEDARNVAAADPAGVDEDGELFGIESKLGSRGELLLFRLKLKFRMDRDAADFDLLAGHAVINQLSPRIFGGDQIEADLFAGPSTPEPVTRVGHYRNERDAVEQAQLAQHMPQKMLCHRVNRDDDLRTVFLEQLPRVPRSHPIEQTRLIRTEMLDRPVVILHQMLVMAQQVVVELRQLFGQKVRLFNRADDVDQTFGRGESLQPVGDCGCGARVATSGIGGDDQKLFGGFVSH